jgi:GxxExxY protein
MADVMSVESSQLLHRDITDKIIQAFYDTYNELGTGFPEFICIAALAVSMRELGLCARTEVDSPVWFRGHRIGRFRPHLIVDDVVIVEVKAQQQFERYHFTQVVHYLKATGLSVGLLMNFGPRPGFRRLVFDHARTSHATDRRGQEPMDTPASGSGPDRVRTPRSVEAACLAYGCFGLEEFRAHW